MSVLRRKEKEWRPWRRGRSRHSIEQADNRRRHVSDDHRRRTSAAQKGKGCQLAPDLLGEHEATEGLPGRHDGVTDSTQAEAGVGRSAAPSLLWNLYGRTSDCESQLHPFLAQTRTLPPDLQKSLVLVTLNPRLLRNLTALSTRRGRRVSVLC